MLKDRGTVADKDWGREVLKDRGMTADEVMGIEVEWKKAD